MRRVLIMIAIALAVAGCSAGAGRPQTPEDLQALRNKIPLLQADECYTDPQDSYARCGKYVTELGSTVGALHDQLANAGGTVADEINRLAGGVNSYQQASCENSASQPTPAQAKQCPAALITIRTNLGKLGSYLESASTAPSSG
jgi:hypothetical protein